MRITHQQDTGRRGLDGSLSPAAEIENLSMSRVMHAVWAAIVWSCVVSVGSAQEPADVPLPVLPPARDPVVRVLLERPPQTPSGLARLVNTFIDLNEAPYAAASLKKLLDMQLDEDKFVALYRELGSAFFLKISRNEVLAPWGKPLSEAAIGAFERRVKDPERIAAHIEQLANPAKTVRATAIRELQLGHAVAVSALIATLADDSKIDYHRGVQEALIVLGSESFEPLSSLAATAGDSIKVRAVETLARLDHPDTVLYALAPAFSPKASAEVRAATRRAVPQLEQLTSGQAAGKLYLVAREFVSGQRKLDSDAEGRSAILRWDAENAQLVVDQLPARIAALQQASRFADQARQILPDSAEIRKFYWTTRIQTAATLYGIDQPWPESEAATIASLREAGESGLNELLHSALADDRADLAVVALRLLGEVGSAQALHRLDANTSLLVQAMRHRNPRIRFAALQTLAAWQPQDRFPGDSFVVEAVRSLIATQGSPRALVVDPRPVTAQNRVGVLMQLGLETHTATDARSAMQMLAKSADYELVVVDILVAAPSSGLFLNSLRRDNRTAHIPLAIVADDAQRELATALARRIELAEVYEPSSSLTADANFFRALFNAHGMNIVPPPLRLQQAKWTLEWLQSLDRATRSRYGWRQLESTLIDATLVSDLAPAAFTLLADLGSAPAQRQLVEIASSLTQPLELRRAAADAFAASVKQSGIMLTRSEMLRQYDRYNDSERQPRDVQQVLASILDTLERTGQQAEPANASAPVQQEPPR